MRTISAHGFPLSALPAACDRAFGTSFCNALDSTLERLGAVDSSTAETERLVYRHSFTEYFGALADYLSSLVQKKNRAGRSNLGPSNRLRKKFIEKAYQEKESCRIRERTGKKLIRFLQFLLCLFEPGSHILCHRSILPSW